MNRLISRGAPIALMTSAMLAIACHGKHAPRTTGAEAGVEAPMPTEPAGAFPVTEAARKEADDIFASRCATCHGPNGDGNGPGAPALNPKPRNFHDKTWQTSVSNDHIDKIIEYGGAAVGKSPLMPPNPDLVAKPEVVAALREHVRGLGQ